MTLGILRVGLYERVAAKCVKGNNIKGELPLGNFGENVQNRSRILRELQRVSKDLHYMLTQEQERHTYCDLDVPICSHYKLYATY